MEYQSLVNRVPHFTIEGLPFLGMKFDFPHDERHQFHSFSEELPVVTEDLWLITAPVGVRQKQADRLNAIFSRHVLPGVGSFKERVRRWHAKRLQPFRRSTKAPHLICMGVAPHTIKISN